MSPIALALDLLLAALLVTALLVGLRLNARLKALRAGQAGFVKAVAELDAAAARAEAGLKSLRAASENTHDELLTRIETARGLIARLDTASERAVKLADAAPAPAATGPAPSMFRPAAPVQAPLEPRLRPTTSRPAARGLDEDLFEVDESALGPLRRRLGARL